MKWLLIMLLLFFSRVYPLLKGKCFCETFGSPFYFTYMLISQRGLYGANIMKHKNFYGYYLLQNIRAVIAVHKALPIRFDRLLYYKLGLNLANSSLLQPIYIFCCFSPFKLLNVLFKASTLQALYLFHYTKGKNLLIDFLIV